MNLKSVELQVAVPRTSEAGRLQQEQQQRPLIDQNQLAGQNVKQSELDRKRSTGMEQSANNKAVRREGSASQEWEQGQQEPYEENQEGQDKEQPAPHPFKGHRIDLSL